MTTFEKFNLNGISTGTKICQCVACGRVFSTSVNFDKHRKGLPTNRECIYPGNLKTENGTPVLTLDQRGIWVGFTEQDAPFWGLPLSQNPLSATQATRTPPSAPA